MKQRKPAYLSLYESLREEIISGVRPYGSRLPSRRVLSRDRGVSAITAEHSIELLCEEGYAESRPRSGCYVVYRETDGFTLPPAAAEHRIVSAPPAPDRDTYPFPALARVMRRVLTEYGEEIMVRSPNTGCVLLREALCRYLARNRGIRVRPDQIVIGAGAEYLYGLVVELLGSGRIYGIEAHFCPLGKDGILSEALRSTKASVLHITPFRSFPSGVTATASKRGEYLRWASEPDRYIVEDDYESEFSLLRKPEETLFAGTARQNVIYLNTFSRTVSPSFRVGYMVLPRALLPVFEERVGFYSCTVPTFEQYVLAELISGGDFERHINRIRRSERKTAAV